MATNISWTWKLNKLELTKQKLIANQVNFISQRETKNYLSFGNDDAEL